MKIDIGNLCTHCGRDTSFGSVDENGEKLLLYVNRIPSDSVGKLVLPKGQEYLEEASDIDGNLLLNTLIDVEVSGYMCPDCQCVECDDCGELSMDITTELGDWLCQECCEKRKVTG